jgi:hypothetical protein
MIHGKYRLRNLSKVIWPWLVRELFLRFALPRPSGREAFALARVGASADPSIRLAYQLRAQSDAGVIRKRRLSTCAGSLRRRLRIGALIEADRGIEVLLNALRVDPHVTVSGNPPSQSPSCESDG